MINSLHHWELARSFGGLSFEEAFMPDDKSKRGKPDRSKVSKDQDYEIAYLAHTHNISIEQARELIDRWGNDRKRLDAAAQKLKHGFR
jgi:hypothetical protein